MGWKMDSRALTLVSLSRRSTVLGAALLAGGALGLFGWDLSRPETLQKVNRLKVSTFSPRITEEEKEWKYAGWVRAVDRARGWKSESRSFATRSSLCALGWPASSSSTRSSKVNASADIPPFTANSGHG